MPCAKLLQSCTTLCDAMDCSPPGSSVHGILQARILESVATSFSRRSSQPRGRTCISYVSCIGRRVLYHQRHLGSPMCTLLLLLSCFSHVQLSVTLWTVAHQAPLPMGFSRQGYWSRLPCPPPGDLPNPGIKPTSLSLLHWWVGSLPLAPPGKTQLLICSVIYLVSRRFPSSSIPGPLGHSLH